MLTSVPTSDRAAVGEPVGAIVRESVGFGVGEPDGKLVGYYMRRQLIQVRRAGQKEEVHTIVNTSTHIFGGTNRW